MLLIPPVHDQATAAKPADETMAADWREQYAYTLGVQAYVFGFPSGALGNTRIAALRPAH